MRAKEKQDGTNNDPVFERKHLLLIVFFLATALLVVLCYLLAQPFLPALAWALALAILAHPVHCWIGRKISKPAVSAAITVVVMAVLVMGPFVLVGQTLVRQASATFQMIESGEAERKLQSVLEGHPRISRLWRSLGPETGSPGSLQKIAGAAGARTSKWIGESLTGTLNFLIAFFLLFYFLRDRGEVLKFIRSLLPISNREATEVLARVKDTVFASVYGTLAVALIQGTLGGLMFWWLGVPAPLLWGSIMGLLAIIPVLGAFVIWIPAAVFLAAQGEWGKALILTGWGTLVVGTVDNLLFPVLVGKRMHLHTVPVFIAIIGGLVLFGASGLVLGPVILALTDAAINLWRSRLEQTSDHAQERT